MKGVIFYYSRTGKTRTVSQILGRVLACEVVEIKDLKDRRGIRGFLGGIVDARLRRKTPIVPSSFEVTQYDMVVIGGPVWAHSPTPALNTLIDNLDLTGRKVLLFVTSRGVGDLRAIEMLKAKVRQKGGSVIGVGSVNTWLKKGEALFNGAHRLANRFKEAIENVSRETF